MSSSSSSSSCTLDGEGDVAFFDFKGFKAFGKGVHLWFVLFHVVVGGDVGVVNDGGGGFGLFDGMHLVAHGFFGGVGAIVGGSLMGGFGHGSAFAFKGATAAAICFTSKNESSHIYLNGDLFLKNNGISKCKDREGGG